jgi:4a-hydroxytetrahydrobiopterin dehydratase
MSLVTSQCAANAPALAQTDIDALLREVPAWAVVDGKLARRFAFTDYYDTIAFVNALAWMTHQQDHHPELLVTYNSCDMRLNTHSAGGALSRNDFICAARADALYAQRAAA